MLRRGAALVTSCVALLCAGAGTAAGNSPGSFDHLSLTTTRPGASTGVVASEVFNARYPNGEQKPLRHSLIAFPIGTRFDPLATDTCSATDADFKARGMAACPASSKIGFGNTTVVTTGTPLQLGPIQLDLTAFARKDGTLMVFSENGTYLSSEAIFNHGRFQSTTPSPSCVVVTESPPCAHGEFTPHSLTLTIPPHSRIVAGRRHALITTPTALPSAEILELLGRAHRRRRVARRVRQPCAMHDGRG